MKSTVLGKRLQRLETVALSADVEALRAVLSEDDAELAAVNAELAATYHAHGFAVPTTMAEAQCFLDSAPPSAIEAVVAGMDAHAVLLVRRVRARQRGYDAGAPDAAVAVAVLRPWALAL